MPRGGRRSGNVGQAYGNRSDLQSAKVPNMPYPMGGAQGYGQQAALQAAQQAVPVGPPPSPAAGPPGAPGQAGAPPGPSPGQWGPLHRPSDRPNEPITHGLPTGPGGGPEVLQSMQPNLTAGSILQRMGQQANASDEIRALANSFMTR